MAKTPLRHRIFAGLGALLFFVTACAFTGMVIWDMVQQSNKTDDQKLQEALDDISDDSTTDTKLEGTQLSGFTPMQNIETLQVVDTKVGTGGTVKAGQTIKVDYTGAIAATGKIFESSLDSGKQLEISLGGVIEGWQQGIPGMKVGGERRLLIPATLAYGSDPPSGIPLDADLVFDITLHEIKK